MTPAIGRDAHHFIPTTVITKTNKWLYLHFAVKSLGDLVNQLQSGELSPVTFHFQVHVLTMMGLFHIFPHEFFGVRWTVGTLKKHTDEQWPNVDK